MMKQILADLALSACQQCRVHAQLQKAVVRSFGGRMVEAELCEGCRKWLSS